MIFESSLLLLSVFSCRSERLAGGDGVEGLSNVSDVVCVEAGDRDTAISGHVDSVLLAELINLVSVETSVGEHADLAGEMAPVVLVANILKSVSQTGAHLGDAARHVEEILVPHLSERLVAEDGVDNASTVEWRVRVDRASELLDAAHHDVLLLGAAADEGEAAGTLTVKAEVLREGLEEHDVVSVLLEHADRVAILEEITRCKALVSRVESAEDVLALDDLSSLLPLSFSEIDTGRVVSTDVEHNDGVVLSIADILFHALEVETLSLGVIVAIGLHVVADESTNRLVNGPGRVRHEEINVLMRVPLSEKLKAEAERTGTGD